jgi:hypothetical protein
MHAICKNNKLNYNIFINSYIKKSLELHMHMCFHVMHTWLLPSQNDPWKKLQIYMLDNILWCMMLTIIYIFNVIHNIQWGYAYNYVNLITYLYHMEKLHMLNVKW